SRQPVSPITAIAASVDGGSGSFVLQSFASVVPAGIASSHTSTGKAAFLPLCGSCRTLIAAVVCALPFRESDGQVSPFLNTARAPAPGGAGRGGVAPAWPVWVSPPGRRWCGTARWREGGVRRSRPAPEMKDAKREKDKTPADAARGGDPRSKKAARRGGLFLL